MGAYIIRCKNKDELSLFLSKGFAGVKASMPNSDSEKDKASSLKRNYRLIRDMKPVKEGDTVFFYVNGKVYGDFKAASPFLEHPNTPLEYKSEFLRYNPPFPCWSSHLLFPETNYFWQMSLEHLEKSFPEGVDVQKTFKLKRHGNEWALPNRFDYAKTESIVHPITSFEAEELLSILAKKNEGKELVKVQPKDVKSFKNVQLSLSVNKHGFLEDKSIIESWLFDNMTLRDDNKKEYKNIIETLGILHQPDAQIPDFYQDFMDIFPYLAKVQKKDVFQIIDINTHYLDRNYFFKSLPNLIRHAYDLVDKVAKGNLKGVQVSLIAKGFHPYLFDYIKARNLIEPGNPVHLIKYEVYKKWGKNRLKLTMLTTSPFKD